MSNPLISDTFYTKWKVGLDPAFFVASSVVGFEKLRSLEWINGPITKQEVVLWSMVNGLAIYLSNRICQEGESDSPYHYKSVLTLIGFAGGVIAAPYVASKILKNQVILITPQMALRIAAFNLVTKVFVYAAFTIGYAALTIGERYYHSWNFPAFQKFDEMTPYTIGILYKHFKQHPKLWSKESFNKQLSFIHLLMKHNVKPLLMPTFIDLEASLTIDELNTFRELYENRTLTPKQATILYHFHVPPRPRVYKPEELPIIDPRKVDVNALSDEQFKWHSEWFAAHPSFMIPQSQIQAFVPHFYRLDLLPPYETFVAELPVPKPTDILSDAKIAYFAHFYKKRQSKWNNLQLEQQIVLQKLFKGCGHDCHPLREPTVLQMQALETHHLKELKKYFEKEPKYWNIKSVSYQKAFNWALEKHDLELLPILEQPCSTKKKVCVYVGIPLAVIAIVVFPTVMSLMNRVTPITPPQIKDPKDLEPQCAGDGCPIFGPLTQEEYQLIIDQTATQTAQSSPPPTPKEKQSDASERKGTRSFSMSADADFCLRVDDRSALYGDFFQQTRQAADPPSVKEEASTQEKIDDASGTESTTSVETQPPSDKVNESDQNKVNASDSSWSWGWSLGALAVLARIVFVIRRPFAKKLSMVSNLRAITRKNAAEKVDQLKVLNPYVILTLPKDALFLTHATKSTEPPIHSDRNTHLALRRLNLDRRSYDELLDELTSEKHELYHLEIDAAKVTRSKGLPVTYKADSKTLDRICTGALNRKVRMLTITGFQSISKQQLQNISQRFPNVVYFDLRGCNLGKGLVEAFHNNYFLITDESNNISEQYEKFTAAVSNCRETYNLGTLTAFDEVFDPNGDKPSCKFRHPFGPYRFFIEDIAFLANLNIDDRFIAESIKPHLRKNFPSARTLDLSGCRELTSDVFSHLEGLGIDSLILRGCEKLFGRYRSSQSLPSSPGARRQFVVDTKSIYDATMALGRVVKSIVYLDIRKPAEITPFMVNNRDKSLEVYQKARDLAFADRGNEGKWYRYIKNALEALSYGSSDLERQELEKRFWFSHLLSTLNGAVLDERTSLRNVVFNLKGRKEDQAFLAGAK